MSLSSDLVSPEELTGFYTLGATKGGGWISQRALPQAGTNWQNLQIDSSTGQLGIG